jgi:hypothetical protein
MRTKRIEYKVTVVFLSDPEAINARGIEADFIELTQETNYMESAEVTVEVVE